MYSPTLFINGFYLLIYVYMCVWFCTCECSACCPEDTIRFSEAGTTGSWKLPDVDSGNRT